MKFSNSNGWCEQQLRNGNLMMLFASKEPNMEHDHNHYVHDEQVLLRKTPAVKAPKNIVSHDFMTNFYMKHVFVSDHDIDLP